MATKQTALFKGKAKKTGPVRIKGYHVKGQTIHRKPYDVKGHERKRPKGGR